MSVVYAAFAELLLAAASVSQTASVQLPGPGTVTVAGPAAGALFAASQALLPVKQSW